MYICIHMSIYIHIHLSLSPPLYGTCDVIKWITGMKDIKKEFLKNKDK